MIDDWLVFHIGWTVLAIMVKRWAKGWALGGNFNWCRIKMIYYLGSDDQRQSIMTNWWIWPYVLNHTRPMYELSLDCSSTTIERPVGETRDDNKGFTQISLFRLISSESIFHLYLWTTLQRTNHFFLHWDRPMAGNLFCNRIPRNYWIGSNRILKKRKVTKGKKETRGHPLYVFCLLAMVLCVFQTHEPNSKTWMTSRYSGTVSSSCSTCATRRVTIVTHRW